MQFKVTNQLFRNTCHVILFKSGSICFVKLGNKVRYVMHVFRSATGRSAVQWLGLYGALPQ